jgi:hypothetical protein
VLEKEPSVFLPVGDYEIRRSLMRVRELFTIFGGEGGLWKKGCSLTLST